MGSIDCSCPHASFASNRVDSNQVSLCFLSPSSLSDSASGENSLGGGGGGGGRFTSIKRIFDEKRKTDGQAAWAGIMRMTKELEFTLKLSGVDEGQRL